MKHGTKVRFRASLSGNIGKGFRLSNQTTGVFLSFADTDEQFCRILSDKSGKIVVARTRNVTTNKEQQT